MYEIHLKKRPKFKRSSASEDVTMSKAVSETEKKRPKFKRSSASEDVTMSKAVSETGVSDTPEKETQI